jgi:hypothetical protein
MVEVKITVARAYNPAQPMDLQIKAANACGLVSLPDKNMLIDVCGMCT